MTLLQYCVVVTEWLRVGESQARQNLTLAGPEFFCTVFGPSEELLKKKRSYVQ